LLVADGVDPHIAPAPQRNAILAALPEDELRTLLPRLEQVRLLPRRLLYEPWGSQEYIYFPTSGMVSVHHADSDGTVTELAQVGREGLLGLWTLLGGRETVLRSAVQLGGEAYRLPAAAGRASFAAGGEFQDIVLRHTLAFTIQLAHTAVCHLRHSVGQQLCRWLLGCLDRVEGNEIRMTHEVIAGVLGVRRQGVTEAAKKLEQRRAIAYHRGRISVLDRDALEQSACECYVLAKQQTREVLYGARGAAARPAGASQNRVATP
jgi:CRP-like cAMP-binding protein